MTEKILKPYTIIPPNLYISRDADRQILNIINDMGRPGYVLVSRQMGKTNLLLNAKRKMETSQDVFVYIDLSNPFNDALSCFENIIDIAIESNSEKFLGLSERISEGRKVNSNVPPHKRHTNELRMLLNSIEGKLVIILDEIDALTKTQYSDQIFAQIRSIYFSRVNFREFEKLTYILSGVIEPNEIIKDPKISPFNIGQKIFLNDFNRSEFNEFIKCANLNIDDDSVNRIFYWTSGNPRITWDICSEVEDRFLNVAITPAVIDEIVNVLYLTTFDKPPIDHIRELVRQNREIRNSIIEIEYKKGNQISDSIKSKLYLSGIINFEDKQIAIKNELIRRCLSLTWIATLEEEDKGIVKLAEENFEKGNFTEALQLFERFLADNSFDEDEFSNCYFYMGFSAYRLSNYPKAIEYFNRTQFNPDDQAKIYFRVRNLLGLAHYHKGDFKQSLDYFKYVMDNAKNDTIYVRALINFGSVSLQSDDGSFKQEAISIFNGIIDETGFSREKLKPEFINEMKTAAHYNLAQIHLNSNEKTQAVAEFKKALELSNKKTKSGIILALLDVADDPIEIDSLLSEMTTLLKEGVLRPIDNDPEKPLDFTYNQLRDIAITAFKISKDGVFLEILPYLNLLGEQSIGLHVLDLVVYSLTKKSKQENALPLLEFIYLKFDDEEFGLSAEAKYLALRFISYYKRPKTTAKLQIEFIALFAKERIAEIDVYDFDIFFSLIRFYMDREKFFDALRYFDIIVSVKNEVKTEYQINYLLIFNQALNCYHLLNNRKKAIETASLILELAKDANITLHKSSLLGDTGLEIIKKNAETILNPTAKVTQPIIKARTYGRNEFVKVKYAKDGKIVETKFKRIEDDLISGLCFILN